MMKNIPTKILIIAASCMAVGLLIGWFIFGNSTPTNIEEHDHASELAVTTWTCSMHPQIRLNEPGDCPICGMDLIPLTAEADEMEFSAVRMSPTAMKLANVQTVIVGAESMNKTIKLNGKIQTDERRRYTQSSHIPGRVEQLMVNFTGEYVQAGQTIARIYSPELVTAQEELLEAQKIMESQPALFNAAMEKLKNWKLTESQLQQILDSGKPFDKFPVLANVSGFVTQRNVNLGDYIKLGQPIYEIADLSSVWVLFDVYESDIQWIKNGDKVEFSIQSFPGETFSGKISYIDRVIDPQTRVAKARAEVNNRNLKLKPEMFTSGMIYSTLSKGENVLSVPKSAVLWTGKRSIVYVKNTSTEEISFVMRSVLLGPSIGNSYVVEEGLEIGEEIAVSGAFSIDAAAQLAAKPSMMNTEGGGSTVGHNHGKNESSSTEIESIDKRATLSSKAKESLNLLFQSYFDMNTALSEDDLASSIKAGGEMNRIVKSIKMGIFEGTAMELWMKQSPIIELESRKIEHLDTIEQVRMSFIAISKSMILFAESLEPISNTLYIQHCPMADSNKGADWLSLDKDIRNPYFGSAMYTCGETIKVIQ